MGGGHSAVVREFLAEMELALGAATVAVSRAGASSLAELAAVRVPAVVIPFPAATDDHQTQNAKAFASTGAVHVLAQQAATAEDLAKLLGRLAADATERERMRVGLAQWHKPDAAERIAESILGMVTERLKKNIRPNTAADSVPRTLMLCLDGVEQPWSGFNFSRVSLEVPVVVTERRGQVSGFTDKSAPKPGVWLTAGTSA
jgi:hypothetical protein